MMDRLEKRREKWLEKLMETRKSKADWMIKVGGAGNESKILGEIQKLRDAILQLEGNDIVELEDSDEILLDD